MSGPKKADVQAALNVAAATSRRAAAVVSAAETAALKDLLRRTEAALASSGTRTSAVTTAKRGLADSRAGLASVVEASRSLDAATAAQREAEAAASRARDDAAHALRLDAEAGATFAAAKAEYDRAEVALRQAGAHYLHNQMAWAQRARALYEQAESQGAAAATARKKAKQSVAHALTRAEQSSSAIDTAVNRAAAARREAEEIARAEAEARRITEEARRKATLALEGARSAINALDPATCEKFRPGARDALTTRLMTAEAAMRRGDHAAAQRAVAGIPADVDRLAHEIAAAQQEFQRCQAEATTALAELSSALDSADTELIGAWSDDLGASEAARRTLTECQTAVAAERFDQATDAARKGVARLTEATNSAAEAVGAHERRQAIGDAVMDVLGEMGFDVSYEEGSKTEPLRIAGQTSRVDGRGDFDLEIPLSGAIDFEVTAEQGDGSCATAVRGLQERLAERGVTWQTTDWGYGHDPGDVRPRTVTRTEERTQQRTHTQGRTR